MAIGPKPCSPSIHQEMTRASLWDGWDWDVGETLGMKSGTHCGYQRVSSRCNRRLFLCFFSGLFPAAGPSVQAGMRYMLHTTLPKSPDHSWWARLLVCSPASIWLWPIDNQLLNWRPSSPICPPDTRYKHIQLASQDFVAALVHLTAVDMRLLSWTNLPVVKSLLLQPLCFDDSANCRWSNSQSTNQLEYLWVPSCVLSPVAFGILVTAGRSLFTYTHIWVLLTFRSYCWLFGGALL